MATVRHPVKAPPAPSTVAEAWQEYHDATRGVEHARYVEVEGWAWARLETRLRVLARRRTAER